MARGTYVDTFPDQFQPFIFPRDVIPNTTLPASKEGTGDNANGVDMRSYMHGTMFRLPLRTAEAAAASLVIDPPNDSNKCTTVEDVMALFDAFKGDVAKRLLFLRYIESIEFYVCDGTPTAPDVKLLFRAGKMGDGGERGKEGKETRMGTEGTEGTEGRGLSRCVILQIML